MDWSDKLRELRYVEGLKQDVLAQQMGVSQASVSQWERGVSVPPEHIQKVITERLAVSPAEQVLKSLHALVRFSPDICSLYEWTEESFVLRTRSLRAEQEFPLFSDEDIGRPITSAMGDEVAWVHRTLVKEGLFSGQYVAAESTYKAERDGVELHGHVRFIPYTLGADRHFAITSVKFCDPEHICDCLSKSGRPVFRFLTWEDLRSL